MNARLTFSLYTHRSNGLPIRLVGTTLTTDLSLEVYEIDQDGLELYVGTLIEQADWAELLAELDYERRADGPRPWTHRY